jgi:hypothetical protein
MKKILLAPFIGLSGIGLILSIIVHFIALSGNPIPYGKLVWGLHIGIFIVWLPAIVVSQTLTSDFKRKDWWKAALRGCPAWMKWMTFVFFFYAIFNFVTFVISISLLTNGAKPTEAAELRGASGHWMAFYSAAFAILFSAINAASCDKERKCRNGHVVSPLAKFCDECGAQIIDRQI